MCAFVPNLVGQLNVGVVGTLQSRTCTIFLLKWSPSGIFRLPMQLCSRVPSSLQACSNLLNSVFSCWGCQAVLLLHKIYKSGSSSRASMYQTSGRRIRGFGICDHWTSVMATLNQASPSCSSQIFMGAEFSHFLKALSLSN